MRSSNEAWVPLTKTIDVSVEETWDKGFPEAAVMGRQISWARGGGAAEKKAKTYFHKVG